jgi:RecG-like helicase
MLTSQKESRFCKTPFDLSLELIYFNVIFRLRDKKKNMKNREIIMRRMERVEGGIEKLQFALRQNNWVVVEEIIQELRDNINDAKAFVQQEPLGPGEINQY